MTEPIPESDRKVPGRAGYSNELRAQALALVRKGRTQRSVAAEIGVSPWTVMRWAKKAGLPDPPLGMRGARKRILPPALEAKVAALRAEGLTIDEVARALHVDHRRISAIIHEPSTQVEIARRRAIAKGVASEALPIITAKAYGMAEDAIDAKDAKSFDAAARGLHALEKIGSSVSGEDKRMQVEHSGSVETTAPVSAIEQFNMLVNVVLGKA